jgi:hypothetical protein
VESREVFEHVNAPRRSYAIKDIKHLDRAVHFLGDHVAFNRDAWHAAGQAAGR